MFIEAGGTPPPNDPPYAPSTPDPSDGAIDVSPAADLSWDGGDPNASDTVYYEVYLGTSFPPSLYDTTPAYPATQTRITYDPGTLNANTLYYWKIVAVDGLGESTEGSDWSFTTGDAPPPIFLATQDIVVKSGAIGGDYTDTHSADNGYESITERESGGKPSNRYSYLEHKWTIDVTEGYGTYTFYLQAHRSANTEEDDFVFAYSTNDVNYTEMLTVSKDSDDDSYQTYTLPNTLSGTVYIRVMDADQTSSRRSLDTVFIDHMYIEAGN
jgi:hypothetical protein